jgi:hypothetical protein
MEQPVISITSAVLRDDLGLGDSLIGIPVRPSPGRQALPLAAAVTQPWSPWLPLQEALSRPCPHCSSFFLFDLQCIPFRLAASLLDFIPCVLTASVDDDISSPFLSHRARGAIPKHYYCSSDPRISLG